MDRKRSISTEEEHEQEHANHHHHHHSVKLRSWAEENQINSAAFFDLLEGLGAFLPEHLLDLTNEDIQSFQPPCLKKLEFVRFQRGISNLRKKDSGIVVPVVVASLDPGDGIDNTARARARARDEFDTDGETKIDFKKTSNSNILQTIKHDVVAEIDIAVPSIASTLSSQTNNEITDSDDKYQEPPLPKTCVEPGCNGHLSAKLGKRKNKHLIPLEGPDFRWIVSCSRCSRKWHACHFHCGHIQKIGSMGSSDIIRHESGRFNRWQKKISPPCAKNPIRNKLSAKYQEQKHDGIVDIEVQNSAGASMSVKDKLFVNGSTVSTSESSIKKNQWENIFSEQKMEIISTNSDFTVPQSESGLDIEGFDDDEFKTMLGALDEDTLGFSDADFAVGSIDPSAGSALTCPDKSQTAIEGEPSTKRTKVSNGCNDATIDNTRIDDAILNDLCGKFESDCKLKNKANNSICPFLACS